MGEGPTLHVHPYDEVFTIQKGRARFTVGDQVIDAEAGDASRFSLLALEDSVIVRAEGASFRDIALRRPDLGHAYVRHIEDNWIIKNERRQLAFATQTAAQRYATFLREYPDLEQRVAQYHIAAFLGVSPTQLSRIRAAAYGKQAKTDE